MVHQMIKLLTEMEPEQSHLRSGISQLIIVDRGLSVTTKYNTLQYEYYIKLIICDV